jgi:hypothetical protein
MAVAQGILVNPQAAAWAEDRQVLAVEQAQVLVVADQYRGGKSSPWSRSRPKKVEV